MISAGAVHWISESQWLTVDHLLTLLSALFLVAVAAAVWVAYLKWRLKWRLASQAAWIDRTGIIARERSRVLEMISSNRKLEELLTEICGCAVSLLPGTNCSYDLQLASESP